MLRVAGAVFRGAGAWLVTLVCGSYGSVALAQDPAEEPADPPDIVEAAALPIHAIWGDKVLSESKFYRRLERSQSICFGEVHNSAGDHYAQSRALRALTKKLAQRKHSRQRGCGRPELAVGFEMFQRPAQPALDGYIAGTLSEAELIEQSQYNLRWGYDFGFYRPLLERARDLDLSALALNARTELTRKIGRTGLASLTPEEQAEMPELDLEDLEHKTFIYSLFGVIPGHGEPAFLTNLYAAQTTWDETMAETASEWLTQSGDDSQLMVFAGLVHCHRSAIPRRITRRTGIETLAVSPIFASELAAFPGAGEGYDVLVVLEDQQPAAEPPPAVAALRVEAAASEIAAPPGASDATDALHQLIADPE
jgi:uncharacterized iron-regulated protein